MAAAKTLQNLNNRNAIIDPATGAPNEYFIRLLQTRAEDQLARVPSERQITTTGGLQGGGDLSTDRELSLTDTGVTPGTYTNATVTVDAKGRITSIISGSRTRLVPFGFTDPCDANEVMLLYTFTADTEFADDWAGSYGNVGVNPASTFTFTIRKRTAAGVVTTVGTITITSGGAIAFATTGTTVSFAPGDQIQVVAQAGLSALASASFTFVGIES